MGPPIPLFWTSGDDCPWFQRQGGSLTGMLPYLHVMDSSSADLLMASMVVKPFFIQILVHIKTSTGETQPRDPVCSTVCALTIWSMLGLVVSYKLKI